MYRIVEHTADLGIEADGRAAEEAMEWAALGLMEVVTGKTQVKAQARPDTERTFFVEAPDLPALLVAFLSELLWLLESEDLLWVGGGVRIGTGRDGLPRADVAANMQLHDPRRDGRGIEVKAVTYHALQFERHTEGRANGEEASDRWHLRVFLDI